MNCSSIMCKKPIDDDSIFCKYCGVKQALKPRQPAPVTPKVAPGQMPAQPVPGQNPQAGPLGAAALHMGEGTAQARQVPGQQEPVHHASKLEIPEPPRFAEIPAPEAVVLPAEITPETDFFIYAGTLKIYKGNSDVVVVPQGVTSLGAGVFRDHKNLREVYLPDTITSISSEAFAGCQSLVKINLPEGLNSIGPKAFMACSSLVTLYMPRTVNKILDNAFEACTSLKEIYLHDGVMTLSYFVFKDCTSLEKIRVPSLLRLICEGTFQGCTALKGIELHDGLKNIERHAFAKSGLEYIVIPMTVINIEQHAFSDMPALQGITVPKITKIDNYTFVGTNLINKGTIRYVM